MDPSDFSSWQRLCRLSAWIRRAVHNFKSKLSARSLEPVGEPTLTVQECMDASMYWIQRAQVDSFNPEIEILKKHEEVSPSSRLLSLSPFFDGIHLRVGGRLQKANIPIEAKHQLILPSGHPVTMLLLEDIHKHTAHGGVEHVIASARQKFWPLNLRRQVKSVIMKCRDCLKRHASPRFPKMANLPVCRTNFEPPFVHTGIDYVGPMFVKHRRSHLKKWGCIFTCLVTRSTHIELADSLETDDFILILRNFIGRRGNPSHIYSDNGTNFKGANNELSQSIRNLNQVEISNFLSTKSTQWHFIPPYSPHFGGAWERLIRSIKIALKAVLQEKCVTESVLRTTLIEIEAVLNSRPLTYNSTDPDDYTPLTPNHFLIGRANPGQPIGSFDQSDLCSRRRWRQCQIIADHIAKRWRREYLPTLTIRQKWRRESPNVAVGDLVTLMDLNKPRAQWDMARVQQIYPGDDGRVRSVRVKTPSGEYTRPASKVCLLEEAGPVCKK